MYKRGYVLLCIDKNTDYDKALDAVKNHDSKVQKIEPSISKDIFNFLPPGTLIVKDNLSSKDTGYITLPMFSSHMSLPVKEGEYVWFFEDILSIDPKNLKKTEKNYPLLQIKNYWVSRIHGYSIASEDPNYTNIERNLSLDDISSYEKNIDNITGNTTKDKKIKRSLNDKSKELYTLPDHEKDTGYQLIFNSEDNVKKGYELYKSSSQNSIDAVPQYFSEKSDFLIQGSNNTAISLTKDSIKNKGEINLVCGKYSLKDYVEFFEENEKTVSEKLEKEYVKLSKKNLNNSEQNKKDNDKDIFLHKKFPHVKNVYGDKESLKLPYKYIRDESVKEIKSAEAREFKFDSSYIAMYMNSDLSNLNFSDFKKTPPLDKIKKNEIPITPKTKEYNFLKTKNKDFAIKNSDYLEIKEEDQEKLSLKYEETVPSILIKSNDIQIVARKELKNVLEKNNFIPDGSIKLVKDGHYWGKNTNSYSHLMLEKNGDIRLDGKNIFIGELEREKQRLMLEPKDMHGVGEGVVFGYDKDLSEPLVLGKTLQVILNEVLETNIEALDYISKALQEISKNFAQVNEDYETLKTWAKTHQHTTTAPQSPTAPGGPLQELFLFTKHKTESTDASSTNNGGQEIKRLEGVIDNLHKMLSRFSKTT